MGHEEMDDLLAKVCDEARLEWDDISDDDCVSAPDFS